MVLRANEKVTRGGKESAKAADRFASCGVFLLAVRRYFQRDGVGGERGSEGAFGCCFLAERKSV